MKNHCAIVVQARLESKRLPRKILSDICGRPMLSRIVRRASAAIVHKVKTPVTVSCPKADGLDIFGATGIDPDNAVEDGRDVLGRMLSVARSEDADHVVRLTADNPLVCPRLIEAMITAAYSMPVNIVANWSPRTFPDGLDAEVYSRAYLEELDDTLTDISDREWFASWAVAHAPEATIYRLMNRDPNGMVHDLSMRHRWTVDYPEDLEFVRKVYEAMGQDLWAAQDILGYLDRHPRLRTINAKYIDGGFGGRPKCS